MKRLVLLIALALFAPALYAQSDCACCTEQHQQFDFWVGDWLVFDTKGTQVGENTITKLEKDCLLNEHWRGSGGGTGRSYSYYNRNDDSWNQVWMDDKGNPLVLKGKGESGKMVLTSDWQVGANVPFFANRVTWTANADGSVTQLWEVIDKKERVISVAFNGVYRRVEKTE